MIHCHLRRERCVPVFLVAQVITSPYSDSIFLSFLLACLLACQSHQNLTSASANSVFRSSANKAKLDLPVRQKSGNASRRLQLYHEETQETSQESQKRLKAERQRDASRRQYQTAEQIKVLVAAGSQRSRNACRHENETRRTMQTAIQE